MLHIMPSLDLMAITPLLIGAKEEEEAGEVTLTEITNSIMVSLIVETMGALPGRTPGTTIAIGSSRNKKGKTSGLSRLDANFAATSDTLHNNALSLFIMGIKPWPTSLLVMLQHQILSLGSPIQVRINMLLQTLPVRHMENLILVMIHCILVMVRDLLYLIQLIKFCILQNEPFTLSNNLHVP
jgi:hypothetical protein